MKRTVISETRFLINFQG